MATDARTLLDPFPAPTRDLADDLARAAAGLLREIDARAAWPKSFPITLAEKNLRDALARYLRTQ